MDPVPTAADLICALLRAEAPAWPWVAHDALSIDALYTAANVNAVGPLLHGRLAGSDWPSSVRQRFHDIAIGQAMWELRHQQTLTEVIAALHRNGIEPVLIKGTALAYWLYADPALRPRGDTDLIIPPDTRAQVHAILEGLGFESAVGVSGEFVSYQGSYTRQSDDGTSHTLDLHWKINNSEVLSRLFTYEELRQWAQPLPALCPHALGASPVHALLIACMHRSTHRQNPYYVDQQPHHDPDRLIWLYDIHLLAGSLTASQWIETQNLAQHKGLRAVCLDGLRSAKGCFHTGIPDAVVASLGHGGTAELPALYLSASKRRQQWMDFCALERPGQQLAFLRETMFPPADYMRDRFGDQGAGWLPSLYARRAIGGLLKLFARR